MDNKEIEKKLGKWYSDYCRENKKAPSWKELIEQEQKLRNDK